MSEHLSISPSGVRAPVDLSVELDVGSSTRTGTLGRVVRWGLGRPERVTAEDSAEALRGWLAEEARRRAGRALAGRAVDVGPAAFLRLLSLGAKLEREVNPATQVVAIPLLSEVAAWCARHAPPVACAHCRTLDEDDERHRHGVSLAAIAARARQLWLVVRLVRVEVDEGPERAAVTERLRAAVLDELRASARVDETAVGSAQDPALLARVAAADAAGLIHHVFQALVDDARLRPVFRLAEDGAAVRLEAAGVASNCAGTVVVELSDWGPEGARVGYPAKCTHCGEVYAARRKPAEGRRRFCGSCGTETARRYARRDWYHRQRAVEPTTVAHR